MSRSEAPQVDRDYQLSSAKALLETFRPRDQKHVLIPRTLRFPVTLGHYLAWTEPSGVRIYLVAKQLSWASPVGVAFRRDQQGSMLSPSGLCDWCLATGPSDQIGLLTATASSRKRVGVNLCLDLSCIQKLSNIADASGAKLDDLAVRLHRQMERFFREALEMELK